MFCTEGAVDFHTKGYIFKSEKLYRIIIGSSNMTLNALTRNKEWNVRLVSAELGEYAQNVRDEFQKLWDSKAAKPMDEVLESYRIKYELIRQQRDKARAE